MAGKQAKILSEDHVAALLDFAREHTRAPLRNQLIVLLSVKAGSRAGEIPNLTWDMVLDADGTIGATIELLDRAPRTAAAVVSRFMATCAMLALLARDHERSGPVVVSERGGDEGGQYRQLVRRGFSRDWPRGLVAFWPSHVHHARGGIERWPASNCTSRNEPPAL